MKVSKMELCQSLPGHRSVLESSPTHADSLKALSKGFSLHQGESMFEVHTTVSCSCTFSYFLQSDREAITMSRWSATHQGEHRNNLWR